MMGGHWTMLVAQYMMIAAGLIFAYIILTNGAAATSLLGGLSSANIGSIKALQGR
jgi:hypothetical protein